MSIAKDIVKGKICSSCTDLFVIPEGQQRLDIPQVCATCWEEENQVQLSPYLTLSEDIEAEEITMLISGREMPFLVYDEYYVQIGGTLVNSTNDDLEEGMDSDSIYDTDAFSWPTPIKTMQELIIAIKS